jgi:hypothetical protein
MNNGAHIWRNFGIWIRPGPTSERIQTSETVLKCIIKRVDGDTGEHL